MPYSTAYRSTSSLELAVDRRDQMADQERRGTDACPICGFDKPHTHSPTEVANRDTYSPSQREELRKSAEAHHEAEESTVARV
jgi:DNA repair exonuclease SbcCD ATPase subunit